MPDQFDVINQWLVNNLLNNLQAEATKNNSSQVLKLRLWRDASPAWETRYRGELELTTPAGFETPFLVTVIIVAALAGLVYYFVVQPLVGQVIDLVYGPVDPDTGERPDTIFGLSMGTVVIIAAIILIALGGKKQYG